MVGADGDGVHDAQRLSTRRHVYSAAQEVPGGHEARGLSRWVYHVRDRESEQRGPRAAPERTPVLSSASGRPSGSSWFIHQGHRVRPGYPIPFAVAAHMQLARYRSVFGRILREEAHPIGCYEVKPLQKRSIFNRGSGRRKRSTRLLKSCLGPTRGVVEGGRWIWVIGTVCTCLVGCGYTRDACCRCRCSFVA